MPRGRYRQTSSRYPSPSSGGSFQRLVRTGIDGTLAPYAVRGKHRRFRDAFERQIEAAGGNDESDRARIGERQAARFDGWFDVVDEVLHHRAGLALLEADADGV